MTALSCRFTALGEINQLIRIPKTATRAERDLLHLQGVIKTQPILMELGLIIVPEAA